MPSGGVHTITVNLTPTSVVCGENLPASLIVFQTWRVARSILKLRSGPHETEAILGISHATLYQLINAGRHDARKIYNKTVITHGSICRFIEALSKTGETASNGPTRYCPLRGDVNPRYQTFSYNIRRPQQPRPSSGVAFSGSTQGLPRIATINQL